MKKLGCLFTIVVLGVVGYLFQDDIKGLISPTHSDPSRNSKVEVSKNDNDNDHDEIADSQVYGIDISHYQNNEVDQIVQQKDKIQFVICKATEGLTYIDPKFNRNWTTLKEHGVIRGAYHFYRSEDDPEKQATFFLNTISTIEKWDIPPILDFEEGGINSSQSIEEVQTGVKSFLELIEKKLGRKPILYTDIRTANKYLGDPYFSDYPLWIANYINESSPHLPDTWKDRRWTFWQKTSTYQINGQDNDLDLFHGSYKDLKTFIRNSYSEH